MRYMKGSKVEVLNTTELPSGSWRCAEIVSGNGHTYYVKYDCYSPDLSAAERVPRKAIRPCPPRVEGSMSWAPGDIVEVFKNDSWKPAQVLKIESGNYFFVSLFGCSRELRAHASSLRVRRAWQDNKWIVIREDPAECNARVRSTTGKCNRPMPQSCTEVKECKGYNQFHEMIDNDFEEHCGVLSRNLKKRPHFHLPLVEGCNGASRKMRAVEKEGRHQRSIAGHPVQLLKKVDAVASPRALLGEKYMHASLNIKATKSSEMDIARREHNAAESISSSVGSCRARNSLCMPLYNSTTTPSQYLDSDFNEVESSCELGREPSLPIEEGLAEEVHRLELYAYRSTMLAFHESGPLSWEKEALMTNLRLMLHISNDEHLLELRHLASARTDIHHSLHDAVPRSF